MRGALILIAALVLLVGCGGSDSDESKQKPREPKHQPTRTGAARFQGNARNVYEMSKEACGAFPPEKIARDEGIRVDTSTSEGIARIAEKYAGGYRGDVHQAAFEGCSDGLPPPDS